MTTTPSKCQPQAPVLTTPIRYESVVDAGFLCTFGPILLLVGTSAEHVGGGVFLKRTKRQSSKDVLTIAPFRSRPRFSRSVNEASGVCECERQSGVTTLENTKTYRHTELCCYSPPRRSSSDPYATNTTRYSTAQAGFKAKRTLETGSGFGVFLGLSSYSSYSYIPTPREGSASAGLK